ncbi:MAG: ATP-grasp domain-containing protein [Jatrophihabitans sp.]
MRAAAFGVWRQLGLDIVLVDGHSQGRYEDLATEFHALDARDESADRERLRRIALGCDGITTLTDDGQRIAAQLAEDVGLPGVGAQAGAAARSKALQRRLCERAGIGVPRWREITSVEDLDDFYAAGPVPAVLKPLDSAGGAGAMLVETRSEAARHWPIVRSLSPTKAGILEEFLPGREVCVDAIVQGGEILFVSSVDCEHMRTVGFLCTSSSYATENPDVAPATAMLRAVVDALDVRDGIVHAEYKIDGGDWTTVEVGLRPGGALVPELTVKVSGVDLYEAQALIALGDRPGQPVPAQAPYAQGRYLVGEGQVRSFVPPAEVLADLPDVKVVSQQLGAGQHARMPLSEAGRAGFAYGWGSDRLDLDTQLRVAVDRLGQRMGLTVRGNDPADPLSSATGPGPWWQPVALEESCSSAP